MWEMRSACRIWWEDLKGQHLEHTSVDGRLSLKWIFRKWDRGGQSVLIWFSTGTSGRLL